MWLFSTKRRSAIAVERVMKTVDWAVRRDDWATVSKLARVQDLALARALYDGDWDENELMQWIQRRGRVSPKWFDPSCEYCEWICDQCCKRGLAPGID